VHLVALATAAHKASRVSPEIAASQEQPDRRVIVELPVSLDRLGSLASRELGELLVIVELRVLMEPSEHQVGNSVLHCDFCHHICTSVELPVSRNNLYL